MEEDEKEDENEGEKSLDYYYKKYEIDDIIHHDYNNDLNKSKSNFQNEIEKMKEKIDNAEQLFNEE